jgi:hypothetical protein
VSPIASAVANPLVAAARAVRSGAWPEATTPSFSLKLILAGTRPPIWRRLRVPGAITLRDLHVAFHAAMGWESIGLDVHLHEFEIGPRS